MPPVRRKAKNTYVAPPAQQSSSSGPTANNTNNSSDQSNNYQPNRRQQQALQFYYNNNNNNNQNVQETPPPMMMMNNSSINNNNNNHNTNTSSSSRKVNNNNNNNNNNNDDDESLLIVDPSSSSSTRTSSISTLYVSVCSPTPQEQNNSNNNRSNNNSNHNYKRRMGLTWIMFDNNNNSNNYNNNKNQTHLHLQSTFDESSSLSPSSSTSSKNNNNTLDDMLTLKSTEFQLPFNPSSSSSLNNNNNKRFPFLGKEFSSFLKRVIYHQLSSSSKMTDDQQQEEENKINNDNQRQEEVITIIPTVNIVWLLQSKCNLQKMICDTINSCLTTKTIKLDNNFNNSYNDDDDQQQQEQHYYQNLLELPSPVEIEGHKLPHHHHSTANTASSSSSFIARFVKIENSIQFLPQRDFVNNNNPSSSLHQQLELLEERTKLHVVNNNHNSKTKTNNINVMTNRLPSSFNHSFAARCSLNGFFAYLERNNGSLMMITTGSSSSNSSSSSSNKIIKDFIFEPPFWFVSQLFIPQSTSIGLQLSCLESHPGAHQQLGSSKEGFSLFSFLTNNTSSSSGTGKDSTNFNFFASMTKIGRSKMRSWFSSPTSDPFVLNQRLDSVSYLVHPENREVLEAVAQAVHRYYRDPLLTLRRISVGQHTTSKDWQGLVQCCAALIQLVKVNEFIIGKQNNNNNDENNNNNNNNLVPPTTENNEDDDDYIINATTRNTTNNNHHHPFPFLNNVCSNHIYLDSAITMENLIQTVVDFSNSSSSNNNNVASASSIDTTGSSFNTIRIRQGVDATLDDFRETYATLDNFLSLVAQKESDELYQTYAEGNHNNNNHQQQQQDAFLPLTVSFLPQTGFLLVLPVATTLNRVGGFASPLLRAKEYELVLVQQQNSSSVAYFKNPSMKELDETVGDLHAACVKAEADVKRKLEEQVLLLGEALVSVTGFIAELECLCCFAMKSIEEGWTRPKLLASSSTNSNNDDNKKNINGYLKVKNCKHPLLSKLLEASSSGTHQQQFVPCPFFEIGDVSTTNVNDDENNEEQTNNHQHNINNNNFRNGKSSSSSSKTKTTILTGANGSGKSILMKSIGVTVFLASIGCFVPCDECEIGVFDAIYTNDVCVSSIEDDATTTEQSFSSSGKNNNQNSSSSNNNKPAILRSSFGQEVSQVASFLSSCTNSSLLLLDEFGSGTVAEDGMALLGGILSYCSSLDHQNEEERNQQKDQNNNNNNNNMMMMMMPSTHNHQDSSSFSTALLDDHHNNINIDRTSSFSSDRPTLIVCTHFTELFGDDNNNNNSSSLLSSETTFNWLTMSARLIGNGQEEIFLFVPVTGSLHSSAKTVLKIAKSAGMPLSILEELQDELLVVA